MCNISHTFCTHFAHILHTFCTHFATFAEVDTLQRLAAEERAEAAAREAAAAAAESRVAEAQPIISVQDRSTAHDDGDDDDATLRAQKRLRLEGEPAPSTIERELDLRNGAFFGLEHGGLAPELDGSVRADGRGAADAAAPAGPSLPIGVDLGAPRITPVADAHETREFAGAFAAPVGAGEGLGRLGLWN